MTDSQPPEPLPPQPPDPPREGPPSAPPQSLTPQQLALQAQILAQRGVPPNFAQPIVMAGAPNLLLSMQTAQVQQFMQSWQGPYPPPDAVERYEKILPGTFDRLIKMAEELQKAQIGEAMEIRVMTHADQKRGSYLGFATTAVAMLGAVVCMYMGSTILGLAFLSVPVMAVAKALIESSRRPSGLPARMTIPAEPTPPADTPSAS